MMFFNMIVLQVLPTAANLKRWNRVQDASSVLYASGKFQTNNMYYLTVARS